MKYGELTEFMESENKKAVEEGYGNFNRPAEAKMCAELGAIFRGKYKNSVFVGIPFKETQKKD